MNFKHLQTFVAICECGTVSRAAARLRITQPALSRRIKALQEELGLRLFHNLGRRLSLTSEGNEFLRHGRALLAQAEAVLATGRALGRGRAGVLRIGAAPHTLAAFFPSFVDKYEKRNPGVRVKLFEAGAAELLRMIEHGELHFAVTLALGHDHFAKRQIPAVPLLVLTTPRSRYGAGGTVDVGTLGGVPLLVKPAMGSPSCRRRSGTRASVCGSPDWNYAASRSPCRSPSFGTATNRFRASPKTSPSCSPRIHQRSCGRATTARAGRAFGERIYGAAGISRT